ncbi:hypothetical protein P8452_33857 [Trifolium repens]|nr:hypothetical protein P8452_33857 [Trifolium repens]
MISTISKIFVWNCRGAASKAFYRFCKQYVSLNKPAMLVLMELRCDPNKLRRSCQLLGYDEFVATDVEGYAGGILVAWKKDYFTVDVCIKSIQYIHLRVKYPNRDWWFFTSIYASPIETKRNILWNDLKSLARNIHEPWLLAGDFNDIVCAGEKKGGASASIRKCNTFKDRIDACNLIDMGAMGPKFTWRGPIYHGGQRIFERLDRALCNDHWRLKFPDGFVKVLTRLDFSNHHPILIAPIHVPHLVAERQFRFESAWLLEDKYDNMLQQSWNKDGVITHNLINVMRNIKEWKFQSLDHIMHEKRKLIGRLNGIQRRIQDGVNHGGLGRMEYRLQQELNDILRKEELMWYQRSRAKWLTDGDRNTKYYHLKTVNRRRRNNIVMLKDVNGQWVEDVDQLQKLASDFYKNLFSHDQLTRDWYQTDISYPAIDFIVKDKLNAPLVDDEIKQAVFQMHPWKAPGPDGFPAGFYQKSWDIVGSSVCNFVKNVWLNPSTIAEVNQTDICLIPKVSHPTHIQQFRPISLCNTIYKIVSKVIVGRLKESIANLVSPFQTGFVPGRNIHENIVVAKEMAHTMHHMKGRKGVFAIKVDLAKAYDKLSWEFIWRVLTEINLPDVIVNIIMHGVTSITTNVKWNGTRSEYFKPQRGIRQGDPLSPYLFVLCMDKLSHLIMHAADNSKWIGIKAGRAGPMVSHLMFADDLLLFGEATEKQMRCVTNTLNQFCSMSGQEVSYEKTSILFSRNVERGLKNKLINMSGFKETSDFGKYLGVPLNGRAPKRSDFQYIIDQVNSKLAAWKANQLSFAGRVTLAKSVIEAVPIYPMMSTKIPKACLDEIHKLQRQFIWGDTDVKRRYHAVGWDDISVPKWMGGLGLRKLNVMNQACLMKLGWKFQTNGEDYWCRVMRGKYERNTSTTNNMIKASSSSLWKNLHEL